jgi:hypothetical protein
MITVTRGFDRRNATGADHRVNSDRVNSDRVNSDR